MLIVHDVSVPASVLNTSFITSDHVPFGTLYKDVNVVTFEVLPVAPTLKAALGE
jgi:hypothetical protein